MGVQRSASQVIQRASFRRLVGALVLVALVATSCGALDESNLGARDSADADGSGLPRLEAETTLAPEAPSETAPTGSTVDETTTSTVDDVAGSPQTVRLRFESQVPDISAAELEATAMKYLTDERGWGRASFTFVADPASEYRVVLAEGPAVDALCLPLRTGGKVSCQNGPVVALNAERWRSAVPHWDSTVDHYRGYLINHEVGHLIGQTHPTPRCPVAGALAGVMEQQTGGLEGCTGNVWPRDWEIAYANERPVVYAPLPDWQPETPRRNTEGA